MRPRRPMIWGAHSGMGRTLGMAATDSKGPGGSTPGPTLSSLLPLQPGRLRPRAARGWDTLGPRRLPAQVFPEQAQGGHHLHSAQPPSPVPGRALRPSSPPRLPSPAAAPTYAAQPLGEVAPAGALGSPVQPARPVQNRLLQGQGAPHSPDARGGHGKEAGATDDDDSRGPAALLFHSPLGTLAPWLPRLQALGARRTRRTGPGAPPSTGQEAAPHAGKREDPACGVPGLGSDHPTTYPTGVSLARPSPRRPQVGTRAQSGIPNWSDVGKRLLALGKGKSWREEPLYLEPKGVGEHKEGELPRTDRRALSHSRAPAPQAPPQSAL